MVHKILSDYKESYNFKNNYLKYFRKKSKIFSIMLIVFGIIGIYLFTYKFKVDWLWAFIVVPLFFCLLILKNEISRIDKEIYKCKKRYEVSKLFKLDFEKRLKKRHIDVNDLEQLDYLISLIEQNLTEIKPRLYIKSGILAGLLGSLWISYLTTIFKYTTSIDEATELFLLILTAFIYIYILYIVIKYGFINDFLHSKYYKLKIIRDMMKSYRLINMSKLFSDVIY